ncbi:MAG: response regulator transcription factor [Cryomorphaceae bacterium]|nr:response regulator transcription factor [Cryomorphaceae bacterium]
MAKILLLEDDDRIAEILHRGLSEEGFLVHRKSDAAGAREVAGECDLLLADLMLPEGENGLDFSQWMRAKFPHVPIIMLTALGTTDDKVKGFDSGADDYLVKPFEMRELVARIKRLLERYKKNLDPVLRFADVNLHTHTKLVSRAGINIELTPREFELLEFMLRNPNRVISRQEIAENVWGVNFDTGTNFIDVYINYLRKKIDKPFGAKLIHTKPGMGFILRTDN